MKWIKRLFFQKQDSVQVFAIDISEPVLTFVELYKKNPKRFSVRHGFNISETDHCYEFFDLKDKILNKNFRIRGRDLWSEVKDYSTEIKELSWLTKDEINYVYRTIKKDRENRLNSIKNKRNTRQRNFYKKLYGVE